MLIRFVTRYILLRFPLRGSIAPPRILIGSIQLIRRMAEPPSIRRGNPGTWQAVLSVAADACLVRRVRQLQKCVVQPFIARIR